MVLICLHHSTNNGVCYFTEEASWQGESSSSPAASSSGAAATVSVGDMTKDGASPSAKGPNVSNNNTEATAANKKKRKHELGEKAMHTNWKFDIENKKDIWSISRA